MTAEAKPRTRRVEVECRNCGVKIEVIPYFAQPGHPRERKYCSRSCSNQKASLARWSRVRESGAKIPPVRSNRAAKFPVRLVFHVDESQRDWLRELGDAEDRNLTRAHVIRLAINRLRDTIEELPLTEAEIEAATGQRFYSENRGAYEVAEATA